MSEKKRIFQIAGVYVAIILGAGFASGQELLQFFANHGFQGALGLVLSGVTFAITGWATLYICYSKNIKDYDSFINYLMGNFLGKITKYVIFIFVFILLSTMLAAGGATLNQAFDLNYNIGVALVGGICFITILFDLKGIVEINAILAPIMVIGGVFIGLYIYYTDVIMTFSAVKDILNINWILSSIIYSSYNIITAITVLASLGVLVNNKKVAFWGGVSGGIVITILGLCMFLPLIHNLLELESVEVPFLKLLENKNRVIETLYLFIIIAAIYTTAISNAFAFFQGTLYKLPFNKVILKFLLIFAAVIVSQLGFSTFVGYIYPIFGIFGVFEIVLILLTFIFRK